MSYRVLPTPPFTAKLGRLAKKYPSLANEMRELGNRLATIPTEGQPLGRNCYKIRIAIKSKGKGKSGGARIITYVHVRNAIVYLLSIYDKSEDDTITDAELTKLLKLLP